MMSKDIGISVVFFAVFVAVGVLIGGGMGATRDTGDYYALVGSAVVATAIFYFFMRTLRRSR